MNRTTSPLETGQPSGRSSSPCGQGNPVGAPGAALITASAAGLVMPSVSRRFAVPIVATLALIGLSAPSLALEITDLRPGSYVERSSGCRAVGSAAAMAFDGRNFSGHYQMCRTDRLEGARIRQTCIEAQGPNWPDRKEIDTDPDRTTGETTVTVQSATAFTFSGRQYRHCGS